MRIRFSRTLLIGLAVCMPLVAHAAGLGRLTVLSVLGQPLRAEIEVVSLERGEAESLSAKLAAAEAFRQANIDYAPALQSLRFGVERRPNNRYVIVMSSTGPVNDPFLDVLVELSWATGRLIREYTFLLDPQDSKSPPAQAQVVPPQTTAQAVPPQAPARPADPPQAAAAIAPPKEAAAPARQAAATLPTGIYQVVPGDTLTKIAQDNLSGGVTLNQMLVALYRANQDAFVERNMNRLRAGRIVNIPDAATASSITPRDANNVVVAHIAEWDVYRGQLAVAVAAATARPDAAGQTGGGRISASVTEAPKPGAPTDRLQLAQADPASKSDSAAGRAAKQDDLAARDRALQDSKSRISQLEGNLKDLENLLSLKTEELTRLQNQAKTAVSPGKAPATSAPPSPKPAAVGEAPTPAPAVDAPKPPSVVDSPTPPPVADTAKKVQAQPTQAVKPPPVPVAETSIIDDVMAFVMNNILYIGGAIGAAVLGGVFMMLRRRRAANLENDLAQEMPADSSSVFGSSGGRTVDTDNPSVQTDFSQGGIGAIDTEEVDPVAEADVYMAYGRDAQAEEILKEALQKDQDRHAVRVKLLEIYSARKDIKAFETTAGELYAATGGQGPDWEKAAALGSQIDPSNTMYQYAAASSAATESTPGANPFALPAEIDLEATEAPDVPGGLDIALDSPSQYGREPEFNIDELVGTKKSADVEFDLNLGETTAGLRATHGTAPEPAKPIDFSMDFELPGATKKSEFDLDIDAPVVTKKSEFDFDLDLPGMSNDKSGAGLDLELTASSDSLNGAQVPSNIAEFDLGSPMPANTSMDLEGINLDLTSTNQTSTATQLDPHWQEVATKLDLAKAYHEMGDREGAKELLGEVMKEGDGVQQQQARRMLETIGT